MRQWIIACMLAEALGIAGVATAYALDDRGLVGHGALAILAAGAWEGLCLGTAQALLLRRRGARASLWIAATMLGAIAGYGLSLLGRLAEAPAPKAESVDPSLGLLVLMGLGMGVAMGALLGAAQATTARRALSIRRWTLANMLGWAPAMAVIMIGAGSAQASWTLLEIAGSGALCGALAGLSVGAATGRALAQEARAGNRGLRDARRSADNSA